MPQCGTLKKSPEIYLDYVMNKRLIRAFLLVSFLVLFYHDGAYANSMLKPLAASLGEKYCRYASDERIAWIAILALWSFVFAFVYALYFAALYFWGRPGFLILEDYEAGKIYKRTSFSDKDKKSFKDGAKSFLFMFAFGAFFYFIPVLGVFWGRAGVCGTIIIANTAATVSYCIITTVYVLNSYGDYVAWRDSLPDSDFKAERWDSHLHASSFSQKTFMKIAMGLFHFISLFMFVVPWIGFVSS